MRGLRLYCNFREWVPTKSQYNHCLALLTEKEREHINSFTFAEDSKACLVGKILIRYSCFITTSIKPSFQVYGVGDHGKPFLDLVDDSLVNNFEFNISHHGDYCVLASHIGSPLGIDVMNVHIRGNSVESFFHTMRNQLQPTEWSFVNSSDSDILKMTNFYRIWCLKESYIKMTGKGLSFGIEDLRFDIRTPHLQTGRLVSDSRLYLNDTLCTDCVFEETVLPKKHITTTALALNDEKGVKFEEINLETMLERLGNINADNINDQFWEDYSRKQVKPFH